MEVSEAGDLVKCGDTEHVRRFLCRRIVKNIHSSTKATENGERRGGFLSRKKKISLYNSACGLSPTKKYIWIH